MGEKRRIQWPDVGHYRTGCPRADGDICIIDSGVAAWEHYCFLGLKSDLDEYFKQWESHFKVCSLCSPEEKKPCDP